MNLPTRLKLLEDLRAYILKCPPSPSLQEAKAEAHYRNSWFTPDFIDLSLRNIAEQYLDPVVLQEAVGRYRISDAPAVSRTIGIVMAGNIPLVGFHDFLCVFLSGFRQAIKPSRRDEVLLRHLVEKMSAANTAMAELVQFREELKGCDAYIATGSNQSARHFEQYFAKYPHLIRKNRTGIAILDGTETPAELDLLADDIQLYYGLGCRNVTQVWVPDQYDFTPLLKALEKYDHFLDNHKYKHNYDYVLTIGIMNREPYLTNGSIVISPAKSPFAGIANLHYAYFEKKEDVLPQINMEEIQVICGHGFMAFGQAQAPGFFDYADGADTLAFLLGMDGSAKIISP